jgi:hypothetical protein
MGLSFSVTEGTGLVCLRLSGSSRALPLMAEGEWKGTELDE